jgi:hypothetical protein
MLESMEERRAIVEHDIRSADERSKNAINAVLAQRNYSTLHKQYETIRGELINTMNS